MHYIQLYTQLCMIIRFFYRNHHLQGRKMEKVQGTMYWKHNEYEIYDGEYIIVFDTSISSDSRSIVGSYLRSDLESMTEEQIFQKMTVSMAFSLAIEILLTDL